MPCTEDDGEIVHCHWFPKNQVVFRKPQLENAAASLSNTKGRLITLVRLWISTHLGVPWIQSITEIEELVRVYATKDPRLANAAVT